MINKVMLEGRLTKEPELKRSGSDKMVLNFTLACPKPKTVNANAQTDFVPCVVWNKIAENMVKYCKKGSLISVVGRISSGSYEKNGNKVYTLNVLCDEVHFLQTNRDQSADEGSDLLNQQIERLNQELQMEETIQSFDIQEDDIQF